MIKLSISNFKRPPPPPSTPPPPPRFEFFTTTPQHIINTLITFEESGSMSHFPQLHITLVEIHL